MCDFSVDALLFVMADCGVVLPLHVVSFIFDFLCDCEYKSDAVSQTEYCMGRIRQAAEGHLCVRACRNVDELCAQYRRSGCEETIFQGSVGRRCTCMGIALSVVLEDNEVFLERMNDLDVECARWHAGYLEGFIDGPYEEFRWPADLVLVEEPESEPGDI